MLKGRVMMLAVGLATACGCATDIEPHPPLTMLVMDPLAAPLACPCVAGHAQRDYDQLADFLSKKLHRPIKAIFGDDLGKALRGSKAGRLALIIGKRSVVTYDAAENSLPVQPLAMLTGKDGTTTLRGLFIVRAADKAKELADLPDYKVLFGPADSDEKHRAAFAALRNAGVAVPSDPETRDGCSTAAIEIVESKPNDKLAGVISSYAMPLLEGCGTVEKGTLRIVGQTEPVPFISAFATDQLDATEQQKVISALLAVNEDPKLLKDLESHRGFVAEEAVGKTSDPRDAHTSNGNKTWPGWRGPGRDGLATYLPKHLPLKMRPRWSTALPGPGLGGVAATGGVVLVSSRDAADTADTFFCLDAASGQERWRLTYPALGKLDYGNSPRATPLLHHDVVYLLGAFGNLHCVRIADGSIVWKKNIVAEFKANLPTWGMCASPLLVDGKLIVNPGAPDASLAALDARTGAVVWQTPGFAAAYSSFIVGNFGGMRQIVGYDAVSLGGWDIFNGRRLWTLIPPEKGDFNVPTPIDVDGKLLVSSENNGTRLYQFDQQGRILTKPIAEHAGLAPDASTPVVVHGKVYGCRGELYCLDAATLKEHWLAQDDACDDYVSFIGHHDRLLIMSKSGELLLVKNDSSGFRLLSRLRVWANGDDVYAHPALVENCLYLRGPRSICCLLLD